MPVTATDSIAAPAGVMQALVLTGVCRLELADRPLPTPGAHEVLIRIAACGICGSDVHGYDGSTGRRIPPVVMGHEAAGTVAAVGHAVRQFAVNDRVTFDSTIFCGACVFCLRGEVNLCDRREVMGVSCKEYRRDGAFAGYVVAPERIVYRLPAELPFAEAAMLEAVSVALHAVRVAAGAGTALVIGAGMIGLLTAQAAKALGYTRILVADIDEQRLRMAAEVCGAETVLSSERLAPEILARAPGGIDVVFEAVGVEATVSAAVACARKGGTVVLIGNVTPLVTFPLQSVVTRQIRLQGSAASAGEYPLAMELMASGAIRVQPLISAVAPLSEGAQWFARLYRREPGLMKVILTPDMERADAV